MSKGINLIPESKKTHSPLLNRLRVLRFTAIFLLFIISVTSMMLYVLIAFSPLPQLREEEQQHIVALSQFNPEIIKIALINERSENIAVLLAKRTAFDKTFTILQSKLPTNGEITGLKVGDNTLSFTFSSSSLSDIEIVLANITQAAREKQFSQVRMSSLTQDTDKDLFQVTVSMALL